MWESTQLINHVCHSSAAFCHCQQELLGIQKTLQNRLLAIQTKCGAGNMCVHCFALRGYLHESGYASLSPCVCFMPLVHAERGTILCDNNINTVLYHSLISHIRKHTVLCVILLHVLLSKPSSVLLSGTFPQNDK